jgi:hypothetical protein
MDISGQHTVPYRDPYNHTNMIVRIDTIIRTSRAGVRTIVWTCPYSRLYLSARCSTQCRVILVTMQQLGFGSLWRFPSKCFEGMKN